MSLIRKTIYRKKALFWGLVLSLLNWAPKISEACSVCTTGRDDENRMAFLLTTVFLSLLPLAMIGGFAWWIWRRIRQVERDEISHDAAIVASVAGTPSRPI